jgi:hypothetical protein
MGVIKHLEEAMGVSPQTRPVIEHEYGTDLELIVGGKDFLGCTLKARRSQSHQRFQDRLDIVSNNTRGWMRAHSESNEYDNYTPYINNNSLSKYIETHLRSAH